MIHTAKSPLTNLKATIIFRFPVQLNGGRWEESHCVNLLSPAGRIQLQSYNKSWAEERKQTLVELSECKLCFVCISLCFCVCVCNRHLTLLFVKLSTFADQFCKDGCTSLNDSFYFISSKRKSWDVSRQDCKDRGADLVIVNSKEEQVKENKWKINVAFGAGCFVGLILSQEPAFSLHCWLWVLLQEFVNSLGRIVWIGLTDRDEEGTWKWVDGSVLNSSG